jgi:predicted GIY-YIG superfamily endonuclease
MKQHNYYTYILTNYNKTVLYTGVTNDIEKRLYEHYFGINQKSSFTSNTSASTYCATKGINMLIMPSNVKKIRAGQGQKR